MKKEVLVLTAIKRDQKIGTVIAESILSNFKTKADQDYSA